MLPVQDPSEFLIGTTQSLQIFRTAQSPEMVAVVWFAKPEDADIRAQHRFDIIQVGIGGIGQPFQAWDLVFRNGTELFLHFRNFISGH